MRNVVALNIPADYLTKIFISHLHTDHFGDLAGMCGPEDGQGRWRFGAQRHP